MIKLSIVVPCYNESENIPLILNRFNEVIDRTDIELILVDNGSTDGSNKVLDKLIPDYKFARVVTVAKNQGYGFGILSGLRASNGSYIGWTHADMQTDPADVIKALKIIDQCPSTEIYVKGIRKKRPFSDNFFTIGMSFFESILLKTKLWDINAQPNIMSKSFYEMWKNPPHDFSLDLYALYMAKQANVEVVRFPVMFPERIHGESKWNTGLKSKIKFIKRTVNFSLKLKKEL